jgi:molybdenum cofactor synthesis domain-containing protein
VYNPLVVTVEIITIGNEVLLGLVQDTNSNYLCRVVRGMGGRVRHIAVVRDEVEAIAEEIKASIRRRADLVFTCGGLGPTDDDLTLAGVAEAVGVKIAIDTAAREFVERRYRELANDGHVASTNMNESRIKMARLPEGASMIENSIGAAPGAVIETHGAKIVSLPGVPAELKGIIEGSLQHFLAGVFGQGSYRERELIVACNDESKLAPVLRKVSGLHSNVYIKSRASRFGRDIMFRIMLSASGANSAEADSRIRQAADDLTLALKEAGIHISKG